jgi:excisionase family DNA binding protein
MSPKTPEVSDAGAPRVAPRFYTLHDVAVVLATTDAQVYALVRSGELPAIKIGGRGQWRIEVTVLDEWIATQYERTASYVADNPVPESSRQPKPPTGDLFD